MHAFVIYYNLVVWLNGLIAGYDGSVCLLQMEEKYRKCACVGNRGKLGNTGTQVEINSIWEFGYLELPNYHYLCTIYYLRLFNKFFRT